MPYLSSHGDWEREENQRTPEPETIFCFAIKYLFFSEFPVLIFPSSNSVAISLENLESKKYGDHLLAVPLHRNPYCPSQLSSRNMMG